MSRIAKFHSLFLFTLLVCIYHNALAQYIPEADVMPTHTHMVYTNLTPAVNVIMGAWPNHPKYTLGYKWQVQSNKRYRISANYILTDNYLDEEDGTGLLVDATDTTLTQIFSQDDQFTAQMRFGVEWIKPRPVSSVFGIELIAEYQYEEYEQWNEVYVRDSSCAFCVDIVNTDFSNNKTVLNQYSRHYLGAGFAFSAGYRFLWNDHWEMQLLFTPEVAMVFPVAEDFGDPSFRNESAAASINLNVRLLEMYFQYHF